MGGAAWEGLGDMALLKEVCHGQGFLRVHSFAKFILFAVENVNSQFPDPVYHACPLLTASLP